MQTLPLNSRRDFVTWPSFDLGCFLDNNPAFVRLGEQDAWAVFCRNALPMVLGEASVWAVRVDTAMMPIGRPVRLVAEGGDPRAVTLGGRVFVFYSVFDRDASGGINGCSVALGIFTVANGEWCHTHGYRLPKHPIVGSRTRDGAENWEKNWVPFPIGPAHIGLIYSHDPWDVLSLHVPEGLPPALDGCQRSEAVQWDYGAIRGGTPPIPYDDDHLITFFHASQVIGSRRVYTAGACVFEARAPYTPRLMTPDPLLVAPYNTGVQRFGKDFALSVVFPMGSERVQGGFSLLCGLDDGEIGRFVISDRELDIRLSEAEAEPPEALHEFRSGRMLSKPRRALFIPGEHTGDPEWPMVNFLKVLIEKGRRFVDVGAGFGLYSVGLADEFEQILAFEEQGTRCETLHRNAALNGLCRKVTLECEIPDPLDSRELRDIDLIRFGDLRSPWAVLSGAKRTLARNRPPVLIDAGTDQDHRSDIEGALTGLDYTFEAIFPRSPRHALCLPRERRAEYGWFV